MKSILSKIPHSLLKSNSSSKALLSSIHLLETQSAHAQLLKSGIPTTESQLIESYCKSKEFSDARQLFDETPDWDLVSATAIIGVFARSDRLKDAIGLFSRMRFLGISPNQFTFSTIIHACTAQRNHNAGKQLHACATKMGLRSDVFVGSSVLDHYAKLGSLDEAQGAFEDTHDPNVVSYTTLICGYLKNDRFDEAVQLFRDIPESNVVSWNAMIGGYSQTGRNEESVNLFIQMCREGVRPNESTFPCIFSAAANIAALGMGKSFHAYAIKSLIKHDVFVGNSLISFYAKCGSMDDSLLAFDRLPEKNVVSWNALICGYAQNGRGKEALEFFQQMYHTGLQPNSVTLLCVLFACNHAGLVEDGCAYFEQARKEQPGMLRAKHYACMVDLLSRSGRFQEAKRFLNELPFDPGIGFWKALLSGCQIHSNAELAELAARQILALDPGDVSSYILLSNVYSTAGQWRSVSMIRKEMKEKGMKRIPGCSWIEIRNKVHIFVTGDRRHVQTDEICMLIKVCFEHLKEDTSSKLHKEILNEVCL
ncbi:pentatricopeptide repeat-containing protein At5g42450, mitochondrial [Magnolia sinica]|uniref:pentatricopeptide repeat-containing protein At5g42450, mitochondrial n=1 Tax=Magnolia sinica TaxID=86752 RepID=UPI00265810D7|nr:pentatricopeptide repeat-containing protein At5g42450, mitochondrial [Magnolia sinica]